MHNALPTNSYLGPIKMLEVYEYFDGPCLFSCRSSAGQIYLATAADDDDESITYLYAPVTNERFQQIRSGNIDLYDTFRHCEADVLFSVRITYDDLATISPVRSDTVDEELLPDRGQRLCIPTQTMPALTAEDLLARTSASNRSGANLKIDLPKMVRNEAPAKFLGTFLTSTQDTMSAMGERKHRLEGRRGRRGRPLPRPVVNVAQVGAGSFGIQIVAQEEDSLFSESFTGEVLEEFASLLGAAVNRESWEARLRGIDSSIGTKLEALLQNLDEAGASLKIEFARARDTEPTTYRMPRFAVRQALERLRTTVTSRPERFSVVGKLIGANERSHDFEIHDQEHNRRYEGKISDNALRSGRNLVIGEIYLFELEMVRQYSPVRGEETLKYTVVGFGDRAIAET